jgi:aspartyl-tRNA(Asn)/glutamyl-tRNA(Gln) amidotransferase subunit A
MGRGLRSGRFTVTQLVERALAAAEREQPRLNAFITITGEAARRRAAELDAMLARGEDLGPLHGIPVAHKDCLLTRGVRTTDGSHLFRNWIPDRDAEVVKRLAAAGMVMIGKTGLHEFTYGISNINPHYGPVRNPHDPGRVSGGSSGGSAAAVAAGIVAAATGTDTGGSIRIPASFCGCVGLKPTFGRISREGVMALGPSQDHVGPLAASVADCALLYGVMAGAPVAEIRPSVEGLRVGLPENYFWEDLDPGVRLAARGAVQAVAALGAKPREVRIPEAAEWNDLARRILLYEASRTLATHSRRREDFGSDVWALLEQGWKITEAEFARDQERRRELAQAAGRLWEEFDLLLFPTTPMVAYPMETKKDLRPRATRLTRPFNLLGWPALSLPCGFAEGLPVGVQLVAAPGNEELLFRAGAAIEKS